MRTRQRYVLLFRYYSDILRCRDTMGTSHGLVLNFCNGERVLEQLAEVLVRLG